MVVTEKRHDYYWCVFDRYSIYSNPLIFSKDGTFPQLKIYLEKPKQFPAFVASTDNCQEIFIYYLRDLLKRLFVRKSIPGNENTG